MSLTTFNTNFLKGSYRDDVTFLLKIAENAPLAMGTNTSGLHPHIDGKQNLAIGYGYDFAANGVDQSIRDLIAAGATITDEASLRVELAQLTRGHATSAQQVTIASLVSLPTEGAASALLTIAIQHRDRPTDPLDISRSFENFLQNNGIELPDSRERAALMSMWYQLPGAVGYGGYFINKLGGLSNMSQALIEGNRAEVWYQIRYQSSNNGTDGAMRRFAEAEMFGLYNDSANVTPDEANQVYRMLQLHRDTILAYESNFGSRIAAANVNYELTGTDQVDILVQALNPARDAIIADLQDNYPSLAGKDLSGYLSTSIYIDPNRNNAGEQLNPSHNGILNARQNEVSGNEIISNDILIGEDGDDTLEGGKGNDTLVGGIGLDRYIWNTGDGTDTIIDEDKQGLIIINNGSPQNLFAAGAFVETAPGSGVWTQTMADGSILTLTHHSPWRLVTADGSEIILGNDWQDGDFGIHLQNVIMLPGLTPAQEIPGDLAPKDFDTQQPGVQTLTDALGNIITDPNMAEPGRADSLNGSAGSDRIAGLLGTDILDGKEDDDQLEGGGGRDNLTGGPGNDLLHGGDPVNLAGIDFRDFGGATADGSYGDFLSAGMGNDSLIGSAQSDALMGGEGDDLMVGGAGHDFIFGDASYPDTWEQLDGPRLGPGLSGR